MKRLRDLLENLISQNISDIQVIAQKAKRLCNTSSLIVGEIDGETLLMTLDLQGFSVSTGAACSSGNPEPSPVLLAMGLTRAEAQSSLRVSLGWETTEIQVRQFVQALTETVHKLREINLSEKKSVYGHR